MEHLPLAKQSGGRFQSGVPKRIMPEQPTRARGLFLRGVVVATYVVDDSTHPQAQGTLPPGTKPTAVYCDVITYGSRAGMRTNLIQQCLVLQRRGGLHDGDIWMPKATTIDTTGGDLDRNVGSNSAYWDGDHVLVGFMDDDVGLPVILGGVPHPAADSGVEAQGEVGNERRRLRLRQVDGHPDFTKHHGSYYGIDSDGNHVVDTRFANDGSIDSLGVEPSPPIDGKGSQKLQLPLDAVHQITFEDMSSPGSPQTKVTMVINKDKSHLTFTDSSFELLVDDNSAVIHLGGDAQKASVDAKVQTEFNRLRDAVNNLKWEIGKMRTPLCEFPVPLLFGDIIECFKQPAAYIAKSQPPINLRTGSEVKPNNAPMDIDAETGEFFGSPTGPTPLDLLTEAPVVESTESTTVKMKS
jgi:hypothetical protein